MTKYQLLDIALKQAFANNGSTQRVPYQLPPQEDNLNWLEGFTDAFQRPVLPQADAGNANGRYIKMGQLNQVLQNLSQAILNVKQGLDNVQGTIDDDVSIKIENTIKEVDKAINNLGVTWLQTINNQKCAGLKNFQGININNFKTKTNAVANLEWCNGTPIQIKTIDYPIVHTTCIANGYFNVVITNTGKQGVLQLNTCGYIRGEHGHGGKFDDIEFKIDNNYISCFYPAAGTYSSFTTFLTIPVLNGTVFQMRNGYNRPPNRNNYIGA